MARFHEPTRVGENSKGLLKQTFQTFDLENAGVIVQDTLYLQSVVNCSSEMLSVKVVKVVKLPKRLAGLAKTLDLFIGIDDLSQISRRLYPGKLIQGQPGYNLMPRLESINIDDVTMMQGKVLEFLANKVELLFKLEVTSTESLDRFASLPGNTQLAGNIGVDPQCGEKFDQRFRADLRFQGQVANVFKGLQACTKGVAHLGGGDHLAAGGTQRNFSIIGEHNYNKGSHQMIITVWLTGKMLQQFLYIHIGALIIAGNRDDLTGHRGFDCRQISVSVS